MRVKKNGNIEEITALWMEDKNVVFIDQRLLPHKLEMFVAKSTSEVAYAISDMVVRGAPAIGAAAACGLAQAAMLGQDLEAAAKELGATRPTAYDLFYALDWTKERLQGGMDPLEAARKYIEITVERCFQIGLNGSPLIKDGAKVLTHCNAGALATVDYGTALAPMRIARDQGKSLFVWVDETRPRLQGANLTAWELFQEDIPHSVIADNAAGHFMRLGEVDLCIVGTDRVAANGDFANKIGTYEKAVLAKENEIPFYVAAPVSTVDFSLTSGDDIPIEERSQDEVSMVMGIRVMPEGSNARNPAFDVTPARYVTGFITEKGVFRPDQLGKLEVID